MMRAERGPMRGERTISNHKKKYHASTNTRTIHQDAQHGKGERLRLSGRECDDN